MKVIDGHINHITQAEKKAIKAILQAGFLSGRVGNKDYYISEQEGIYTVKIYQNDRGLISVGGSKLRLSCYTKKFTL